MLDEQVSRLARERIQIEITDQNARLATEIARIKAEMAARGVLNSGATMVRIANLCTEAAKDRGQLAWQTLYRFISTAGVRYGKTLADDLKSIVSEFLPPELGDLKAHPKQFAQLLNNQNIISELERTVESGRVMALARVQNEIDLFVVSLKNRQDVSSEKADSTTFNIYSPVGSIQTGPNAVAFVSQKLDSETRNKLNKVLDLVEQGLSRVDSLPGYPKGEVIEVVREAKAELAKTAPNSTKVRSLLSAVATSIQTVASMKPAYEGLKAALALLGITLP